jgi:hypothetical protein
LEKGKNLSFSPTHLSFQDKKHYEAKSATASGLQAMYDKLREENTRSEAELKAAQTRYEAISVGKFASEDGGKVRRH